MQYQVLDSMLLNEAQRKIEQKDEIATQKDFNCGLEDRLPKLEAVVGSR